MKEILILSSKNYPNSKSINYGDCIIINTGSELIIYDCGSQEHADRIIDYMDKNNFKNAKLILSHNDSDHYKGIDKLLQEKKLSKIYTTLLLKYKNDLLERIDDKRKTRESVSREIIDLYDNIAKLSGEPIFDIYETTSKISEAVSIIAPEKDYMLDTVAKHLDGREGDTIDGETAVNATSIQVEVKIGDYKLLLCGDCSYAAIEDKVFNFDAVQLPHHGKPKQAEKIFDKKFSQPETLYIVSDNTGNTNGGSDKLTTKGHRISNTKDSFDIIITPDTLNSSAIKTGKTLGK